MGNTRAFNVKEVKVVMVMKEDTVVALFGDETDSGLGAATGGRCGQATPGPQPSRVSDRHFFTPITAFTVLHVERSAARQADADHFGNC